MAWSSTSPWPAPEVLLDDTIAAISTPPGEGAIAIIRISGPQALDLAGRLFRGKKPVASLAPRLLHFGVFYENEERLDEGLLALFPAPGSYTGEPMAEIHCHGGVLVSSHLLETILAAGARAAEPGEFTRRAFLNGKMDLTQAEAVMDVIRASTPRALHAASEQLEGRLGREIQKIQATILGIVAHLEAYIDFPEEGIEPHVGQGLLADIDQVAAEISRLLATASDGRILREGVRLVLCGAPNAGKSSLLNRLLGFERAIVSPTPGTTRDTIEEFASLRGIPFRITDTAGLRETQDSVEREGVERAHKAIEQADVIVHVIDVTRADTLTIKADELVAFNKIDLSPNWKIPAGSFAVSSLTGDGIDTLVDAIVTKARGDRPVDAPMLAAINARHQACLKRAAEALQQAAEELKKQAPPELAAVPLRAALDAVGEVTGAADIEDILGKIFSTFCIGK